MEWLVKDIWTGANEKDDVKRLTIALESSFERLGRRQKNRKGKFV